MANNYIQFSTYLSLPDDTAEKYAINLARKLQSVRLSDEGARDGLPESFGDDEIEGWNCEVESDKSGTPGVVIFASESGNPEGAALFIQHLIQKYFPGEHAEFSWADWCDKPRIDCFSGGAAFITAEKIDYFWTGQWLDLKRNQREGNPENTVLTMAALEVLKSADDTGCSEDLTVVSSKAIKLMERALEG